MDRKVVVVLVVVSAMIVVKDSLLVGFCFSCWCVSDPIQSTPSVSTNSLIIARPRSAPDIDMHPDNNL